MISSGWKTNWDCPIDWEFIPNGHSFFGGPPSTHRGNSFWSPPRFWWALDPLHPASWQKWSPSEMSNDFARNPRGFFRLVLRFAVPCIKISTPELSCWKIGSHHWVGLEHLQETIKSPKHIQTCGLQQWIFSLSTISGICQITTVFQSQIPVFSRSQIMVTEQLGLPSGKLT